MTVDSYKSGHKAAGVGKNILAEMGKGRMPLWRAWRKLYLPLNLGFAVLAIYVQKIDEVKDGYPQ